MLSRHPVGDQRASEVKFLKPFSSGPPPRSSSADGSGGHRWKHRVPAARSFSWGFFLPSPGKNAFLYPEEPRNLAEPLPQGGAPGWGGGGSSPSSMLPTWTDLLGLEKGSRVSLGVPSASRK